jgi:hypothetical protein
MHFKGLTEMKLSVKTFNNEPTARCYILQDVESIEFTTANPGGYIDATVTLNRKSVGSYLSVGYNYHVQITDSSGDVCWEGRIHEIPRSNSAGDSFSFKAVGYYANLADLSSIWLPYYPDPTELATIILEGINGTVARNGYGSMSAGAPALIATASSVPSTGNLVIYTPDKPSSVREHLDALLSKYGDSLNTTLYWQVWNNRTFYLFSRPNNLTPYYSTYLAQADSYQMGLSSDNFYTRVTVAYKDYYDTLYATANNTAMQTKYASRFGTTDNTFTSVPFIREPPIVDITGHGIVSSAQAMGVANTLLNRYSSEGVRIFASSATFSAPNLPILDSSKQPVPLHKIQAGRMVLWKDLVGASIFSNNYQSTMLIGQTKYTLKDDKETIQIDSEGSRSLDNLLNNMMVNIDFENGVTN